MAVGGNRPPRRARSIDVLANTNGPNPFAAPSTEFLRERRQRSKADAPRGAISKMRGASGRAPSSERRCDRDRKVLDAIDKLEDRDTRAQGANELEHILSSLLPGELSWYLKLLLNRSKPVQTMKGRREQLLLLVSVVRQFNSELGDGVLFDRILPFIIHAATSKDMHETSARVIVDIYLLLVPDQGEFLSLTPLILKKLLDPLQLGTGWDVDCKRGCVFMLTALTNAVMDKAEEFGRGFEGQEGASVGGLLENYTTLLIQCMAVNHDFEEGLLQCIARVAACDPESIVPHARGLAERCAIHLLDTPSAPPDYAIEDGRPESPTRTAFLTRELALVCCLCLWHIAERVVPLLTENELKAYYNVISSALSRDNLNLYRLTRHNEHLRMAIARAVGAWQSVCGDVPNVGPGEDGNPVHGTWHADDEFSKKQQLSRLARPALTGPPPQDRRRRSPGPRRGSPPPAAAAAVARRPPSAGLPTVLANARPASVGPSNGLPADPANPRPASAGSRPSSGSRARSADRIMGKLSAPRMLSSLQRPREASTSSRYPSSAPHLEEEVAPSVHSEHSGFAEGPGDVTAPLVATNAATMFPTEVRPASEMQSQAPQPSVPPPPQPSQQPPPPQPSQQPLGFDDLTNRVLPMPGDLSDDEDRGPPPSAPPVGGSAGTIRPEQLRPPLLPSGIPSMRPGMGNVLSDNMVADSGWSHLRETAPDLPSYNPSLASLSDHAEDVEPAWLQLRHRPRLGLRDSRPRSAGRSRTQESRGVMPCNRNNSKAPSQDDEHDEGSQRPGPSERIGSTSHRTEIEEARSAFSRASRGVRMAREISHQAQDEQSAFGQAMHPQSASVLDINRKDDGGPPLMGNDPGCPSNTRIGNGAGPPLMGNDPGCPSNTRIGNGDDQGVAQRPESGAAGPVPTAGCVPPMSPEKQEPRYDELPKRPSPQAAQNLSTAAARMLDRDVPYLSAVMQYLTSGRVDHALQCAFQFGNEKTLLSTLQFLKPNATWSQLPGDVAAYLAHVLVLLLCKDPLSEKAKQACAWLEALARMPGGREALARENQQELKKALFCLSGVPGDGGKTASWLYYQLFQDAR